MKKGIIRGFILLVLGVGGYFGYTYYRLYSAREKTVSFSGEKFKLKVLSSIPFSELGVFLKDEGVIDDAQAFQQVIVSKEYQNAQMNPGIVTLEKAWNYSTLANQLYLARNNGEVEITFNNVRLKEELAERLASQIEATKDDILNLLKDPEFCQKYGFNTTSIMTMFLPDTYRIKWKTSAEELIDRMAQEYKKFWTDERKAKASRMGLSQSEVSILASIVQAEQSRVVGEQPRIAGLYLNRIRVGMPLQSDPTLIFALGDFSIKRVLNAHKEINSPYNTYLNGGLPPGPINLPEKHSLNSVLNAEDNNYTYMCAKPGGDGTHNFTNNYKQHLVYAREYQKWIREYMRNQK